MSNPVRLRINLNMQALPKIAGLLSNTVILGANTILLASNITQQLKNRRTERLTENLEISAQMASAIAGFTKLIAETVDRG